MYLGDAHAVQGDGGLNGDTLETSMDIEFTVLEGKRRPEPRLETTDEIMAMGLNGSVHDALREATSNMADWFMKDYN